MSHFKQHSLAILPLLSLLAMSPSTIQTRYAERTIASVSEEVKTEEVKVQEFKRFKEFSDKVDPASIVRNEKLTIDDLKKQDSDLKVKLEQTQVNKDKKDLTKEDVAKDRAEREALVVDLLFIEDGVKALEESKSLEPSDKEALEKSILSHKGKIEELLTDLDQSETLLAEAEVPVKEEPKAEEPKKDDVIVADDKKDEPKKEEPKVEDKHLCEAQEKNELLTKQIEQLMNDQKQIMQTMMSMTQMMISMYQNQQQQPNPYYSNSLHAPNPYQYNQPFSSGNWVYYPSGFQPSQTNIFMQPQQPQQQGGFYPAQAHEQSNWNLAPSSQYSLQADPRYQVQPVMPGAFGAEAFSYNFSSPTPGFQSGPVAMSQAPMMAPSFGM